MKREPLKTDHEYNELRLVANEIMRQLYEGGKRDQLHILEQYAKNAIQILDTKGRGK